MSEPNTTIINIDENQKEMDKQLRKLEHAFWDLADLLADNLPEENPYEEDPDIVSWVNRCRERFEVDKEEFDQIMKQIRRQVIS